MPLRVALLLVMLGAHLAGSGPFTTLAEAAALAADASSTATASPNSPVLLIHGFQPTTAPKSLGYTTDCKAYFEDDHGGVEAYLQQTHPIGNQRVTWSGPIHYLGFYNNDAHAADNRDVDLRQQANHCTGFFDADLSTNYSSKGQTVQIVAHSMGWLITRWALYASQFEPRLPKGLRVQHVVTFDTPHSGVLPGFALFSCAGCLQGAQMYQGSPFMNEMYAGSDHGGRHHSAQNSQDMGETD